ncbi:uncharacterized protein LOC142353084 [Convolutriloba macropyga]|uniref:uncharacterized protein LOC142353084 n=1 Tax=Convolutriloba macropyga TaxID=536237 RepID=UPI003F51F768
MSAGGNSGSFRVADGVNSDDQNNQITSFHIEPSPGATHPGVFITSAFAFSITAEDFKKQLREGGEVSFENMCSSHDKMEKTAQIATNEDKQAKELIDRLTRKLREFVPIVKNNKEDFHGKMNPVGERRLKTIAEISNYYQLLKLIASVSDQVQNISSFLWVKMKAASIVKKKNRTRTSTSPEQSVIKPWEANFVEKVIEKFETTIQQACNLLNG